MRQSAVVGKIYPNGEFALWKQKMFDDVELFYEGSKEKDRLDRELLSRLREKGSDSLPSGQQWPSLADPRPVLAVSRGIESRRAMEGEADTVGPLGLSKHPISRKRGALGINQEQRRRLRNATFLMERWAGNRQLAMLTCTFPALSKEEWGGVQSKWAVSLNRFLSDRIRRGLSKTPGLTEYAGCVEIQTRRMESRGEPGLHIHCLIQAKSENTWRLAIADYVEMWRDTWKGVLPGVGFPSQCVDIETVRTSASAYIGKYMSKGVGDVDRLKQVTGGWHPSTWVFISADLKRQIERNTSYGAETGELLENLIAQRSEVIPWKGEVRLGATESDKGVLVATYGRTTLTNDTRIGE